jgi:hypothetical protein
MGEIRPCSTADEAVTAAIGASFGSVAVSVRRSGDLATVELGSMTPFGPVVRRWEDVGASFVRQLLDDTVRAADGPVFLHEPADQAEAACGAFAAFARRRPDVPVMSGPDGRPWARWWSVAPNEGYPDFAAGDELVIHAEGGRRGTVLRYRHRLDGRDGGIHAIVDRLLTPDEKAVVRDAVATVESFTFGRARTASGRPMRTQLLMLRVPPELARAFPDGRLPRQSEGMVA